MKFTKMQGAGNDYVYVNCFEERVDNPADVARKVSNRNFGIGSDGLILIMPSTAADVRMRMFNSDGSESEMCGNGIRCVAKYAYDHGIVAKKEITAETGAGILTLQLFTNSHNLVDKVRVNMGEPRLTRTEIPMNGDGVLRVIDEPLNILHSTFRITCVSMGNPHCVIFVDDVEKFPVDKYGPLIENHELFPRRTNVEFVKSVDGLLEVRVFERGAGWTMACGTGACATVVAAALLGKVRFDEEVQVRLPGGSLWIKVWKDLSRVTMRGPAALVFEGQM